VVNDVGKLDDLVAKLKAGDRSSALKEQIAEFLLAVDPARLYLAEEELLEAGLSSDDLMHRCSAETGVLRRQMNKIREGIPADHFIGRLLADHERMLDALDELERANAAINAMSDPECPAAGQFVAPARRLLACEAHITCEERVLFPEMERHGEPGPPRVMEAEHDEVRRRVAALIELVQSCSAASAATIRKRLDESIRFIALVLRDHFFKEVFIIYPIALHAIRNDETWNRMMQECRLITGKCASCPGEPQSE